MKFSINCRKMVFTWYEIQHENSLSMVWIHTASALCQPFVHGGISINSSNSLTWTSQHFHCKNRYMVDMARLVIYRGRNQHVTLNRYIPLSSCHGKQQDLDGSHMQNHGYPSPCRIYHILYFYISSVHLYRSFSWAVEQRISQQVPCLYHR